MRTDTRIALTVIGVYSLLSLALLPAYEYLRALGGGAAVFGIVAGLAGSRGRGPIPGLSVLAVAFGAGAVLAIPTFPAMGGITPAAVPLGFLGMQAAMLLWAALRWDPPREEPKRMPLFQAWKFGLFAAAGLSVIAAVPALLITLRGSGPGPRILLVFPAYAVGLLGAATCYWLLQRVAHLATGRYLIGALGGFCAYGAFAPVVQLFEGEPMDLKMMVVIAAIAGGLVGPAVSLSARDEVAAA